LLNLVVHLKPVGYKGSLAPHTELDMSLSLELHYTFAIMTSISNTKMLIINQNGNSRHLYGKTRNSK